jgi:hypothetical protein
MAAAISRAKVSSGQCFRAIVAKTWRENAHDRGRTFGAIGKAGRFGGGAERALLTKLQNRVQPSTAAGKLTGLGAPLPTWRSSNQRKLGIAKLARKAKLKALLVRSVRSLVHIRFSPSKQTSTHHPFRPASRMRGWVKASLGIEMIV